MTSGPAPLHPTDLTECLTAFALGLQNAAAYPDGHPVLEGVAADLEVRVGMILEGRPSLTIGVAPHQLVVDGIATDPNQPVLRDLASRLHAHALGGVMLTRGVSAAELAHLLALLAIDPAALPAPVGLEGPELLAQWPSIRLFPVASTVVAVFDEADGVGAGEVATQRAAALWLGLARAALPREAARQLETADAEGAAPPVVAAAIAAHPGEATYDQSVMGYLAQSVEALATDRGPSVTQLRHRVATLLTALDDATLGRLVAMQGDRAARRRVLEQAVSGLPATALRRLLHAVATVGEEPLTPALLRLLDGLAGHAERAEVALREAADIALRETVLGVVRGWPPVERTDPGHRLRQEGLRRRSAVFRVVEASSAVEADRLLAIAIETGVLNASVWRQVETLARRPDPQALVSCLDDAPAGMVREALWAHLATPDRLREWLGRTPLPEAAVDVLVWRLGGAAVPVLLDALEERPDEAGTALVAWLASLGEVALPAVADRLVGADPAVRPHLRSLLPASLEPAAP